MNVLILTPDGVGSTLLQRTLTVQMILSDFDKQVINLHELSNGLISYYSYELQSMVLGKVSTVDKTQPFIGYSQTLPEIVRLLESVDHYKTSRLAHYHIVRRNDNEVDQKMFYEYLNSNFFIISAKRRNLLDYGLSWILRNIHKKLNVYTIEDKINSFYNLYKESFSVDTDILLTHLNDYKKYIDWTSAFDVSSNFYYEDHVAQLEEYILALPIFSGRQKNTWANTYNITFNDYNKCHKTLSDIGAIALDKNTDIKLLNVDKEKQTEKDLGKIILNHLPETHQTFFAKHESNYKKANASIGHMVKLGLITTTIPIKKHTFAEKKYLIKNFDECLDVYNNWIIDYPELGSPIDDGKLRLQVEKEQANWSI